MEIPSVGIEREKSPKTPLSAETGFFRDVFDAAGHCSAVISEDLQILAANESFSKAHQYAPEDLQGMALRDICAARDWGALEDLLTAKASKDQLRVEVRHCAADGTEFPVIQRWKMLRNEEGTLRARLLTIEDRTLWKAAESSMREAVESEKSLLRAVLDQLPAGIILAEAPSGRITMANRQVSEILRRPFWMAQGIEEYGDYRGTDEDGKPYSSDENPLARAIRHGETTAGREVCFRLPDGQPGWIRTYAAPVLDSAGNIKAGVSVFFDVTDQRQVQEALRISEEKHRLLTSAIPQIVWVADAQGNTLFLNEFWFEYTGVSRESTLAEVWSGLIHPEDQEESIAAWARAQISKEAYSLEFRIRQAADGVYRWHYAVYSPITDGAGNVAQWVGTAMDIHERMCAEQDLARALEDKQRLLESNEELRQLTYAASHDLRAPLRTMASFAQLISRRYQGKLDPDADEYLQFMVSGAHRMSELVDGLLEYGKVADQGEPLTVFPAGECVEDAMKALNGMIRDSGAKISVTSLPLIPGNRKQITAVFQNLIANAIRYRSTDPPRVEIAAKDDGLAHIFSVRDNGIGIAPEDQPKIFQIFRRVEASHQPGTGIGLAVCRKILERHRGSIWVESEPGVGSIFYFRLLKNLPVSSGSPRPA